MERREVASLGPTRSDARDAVLLALLSGTTDGMTSTDETVVDLRDERIIDLGDEVAASTSGAYATWGKRLLETLLVLLALPFWGLLYAVIALALLAAQGRPIHYRSTRVGLDGRELTILKFRTMTLGADDALATLLAVNPALAEEFKDAVKLRSDPRVTPLGRLLRQTSLDELPQLLNVIKGDMSLVGPRPVLRTELTELYGAHAKAVIRFRPGLTGLWQVSGRSLLTYEERVALDLRYTEECSLRTDASILLRTLPCVLRGYGAF